MATTSIQQTSLPRVKPEVHYIKSTPHVPNSELPVLVYRNVFTPPTNLETFQAHIEPNGWFYGGQWKAYYTSHFHSNCHECYAVLSGSTVYQLGKSPLDPEADEKGEKCGLVIEFKAGDVFVLPAGTAHCSISQEGEYEHIGFYPDAKLVEEEAYDMNFAKQPVFETKELIARCEQVPIPITDPLYGDDGPLPGIWKDAERKAGTGRAVAKSMDVAKL